MKFRYDIQALRGFAVLIVLLFHAGVAPVKAGYLGVDVFFVISGFLMTSLLMKHIDLGDFSFVTFYYRRAKRLLPAVCVVLLLTTIASLFFMTVGQFRDYKNSLLGALSFTANFALYDQTDYFGTDAKTKPLLHMWSLSVEEQFYLILPFALYFTPRRFWKGLVGGCFLLSLGWCFWRVGDHPEQAFYFLPSRMWELMLGAIAAQYPPTEKNLRVYGMLLLPALCALVFIPVFPLSMTDPGISALVACLATFVVLQKYTVQPLQAVPAAPVRWISRLGDYSYSLYLVHWPIFAFAANALIAGELSLAVRWGLLLLSLLVAVLLYHFVEEPIHHGVFPSRRRLIIPLLAASLGLAAVGISIHAIHNADPRYRGMHVGNQGLNKICDQNGDFKKLAQCQTTPDPKVLVWGDSYAMHWLPGLASEGGSGIGVAQATRHACNPFTTLSYLKPPKHNRHASEQCINFNRDVLKSLPEYKSVEVVVLAGIFETVTDPNLEGLRLRDGKAETISLGPDAAAQAMAETVREIRAMGKKVVILSPPVKGNFDIGLCLEKLTSQKVVFGDESDCSLSLQHARLQYADVYHFLDLLPKEADVNVVHLSDYMCEGDACMTRLNGTILYEDTGHISIPGSIEIAKHIGLMDLLIRNAR